MNRISHIEKFTAVVSVLMAIAILSAGVRARQQGDVPVSELERLELDLRTQLDLAYSHDRRVMRQQLAHLEQTLAAWRQSAQEPADRQRLAEWLVQAMRDTMPGLERGLPPTPDFVPPVPLAAEPAPALPAIAPHDVDAGAAAPQAESPAMQMLADVQQRNLTYGVPDVIIEGAPPPPRPVFDGPEPTLAEPPGASAQGAVENARGAAPGDQGTSSTAGLATDLSDAQERTSARLTGGGANPPVQINLVGLQGRLQRYHRALEAATATVVQGPGERTDADADALVELLESLRNEWDFLQLYYEALNERERQSVVAPTSPADAARRLHEQIGNLTTGQDGDFLQPFDAEQSDARERLQRRLEAVAAP